MAFFPKDAAIQVPQGSDLEKAIQAAGSVSEIQTLLHEAARAQKLIEPDPYDPEGKNWFGFRPVETPQPQGFAKTLVVDGKKIVLESTTEDGLVQEELKAMRALFAQPAAGAEQQRDSSGRFVAQADAAGAAMAPSVTAALQAAGIDVRELREFTETKRTERFTQSWADAAAQFRDSHPEWIGGSENQKILSDLLSDNNLTDAEDKGSALEAVYAHAVEHKLLVEPAETRQRRTINEATSYDDIKAAVGYHEPNVTGGSGFFGR